MNRENRVVRKVLAGVLISAFCGMIPFTVKAENAIDSNENDIVSSLSDNDSFVSVSDNEIDSLGSIVISGKCGENAQYSLYEDGTFEVTGQGAIDDLEFMGYTEWNMEYGSLIKNIVIQNGITEIGNWYFRALNCVKSVEIPSTVVRIGEGAFSQCWNLPSIEIPDSVKSIEKYAFAECMKMESIQLSQSITVIDDATFYHCDSLKSIVIPKGVTKINCFAFSRCHSLLYIDIPNSVMTVERYAFGVCYNLQLVRVYSDQAQFDREAFKKTSLLQVAAHNNAKVKQVCSDNKIDFTTNLNIPNPTKCINETIDGMMGFGSIQFWMQKNMSLNNGNYEKYIDRINPKMERYDIVKGVYDSLVEASDNDGIKDYCITLPEKEKICEQYVGTENQNARQLDQYAILAFVLFEYDHPEVFWLGPMVTESEITDDGYYVMSGYFKESVLKTYSTPAKIREAINRCNETLNKIKENVNGKTTYEKIQYVNQWIFDNTEYNTLVAMGLEVSDEQTLDTYGTAYSILTGKKGKEGSTCEGYARGFKMICDYLGIPCVYECGNTAEGPHAWNAVCIDSKWYYIDTTWNMTNIQGWFLCGRKTFTKDHSVDDNDGLDNGPVVEEEDYVNTVMKPEQQTPIAIVTKDDKKTGKYKIIDSKKREVTFNAPHSRNSKVVSIPSTVRINGKAYKVTAISSAAFKGNKKITKIVVGSNVKNIGANAFKGCKNLKIITIKSNKLSTRQISKNAFKGISRKTVIKVPKKKLKAYKKLLRKKGLSAKVKLMVVK